MKISLLFSEVSYINKFAHNIFWFVEFSIGLPGATHSGPSGRRKRSKLFVVCDHDIDPEKVQSKNHVFDLLNQIFVISLMPARQSGASKQYYMRACNISA